MTKEEFLSKIQPIMFDTASLAMSSTTPEDEKQMYNERLKRLRIIKSMAFQPTVSKPFDEVYDLFMQEYHSGSTQAMEQELENTIV